MWVQAVGIGALVLVGTTAGCMSGSLETMLEVVAVAFVGFMMVRVGKVVVTLPRVQRCEPPVLHLPEVIDRRHLPAWGSDRDDTDRRLVSLVDAVVDKIRVAADESAIHAFVAARLQTLRRQTEERYASSLSDIDALGFEGVMGTILGLMVFLAQAGALFDLPPLDGEVDSSAIVAAIAANVGSVQLTTVMTAFVTSLIGWGARAWLGGVVDGRRRRELAGVTEAEAWLQDGLLARLHLPAQVQSMLTLPELDLSDLAFDVEYVTGGIRLRAVR